MTTRSLVLWSVSSLLSVGGGAWQSGGQLKAQQAGGSGATVKEKVSEQTQTGREEQERHEWPRAVPSCRPPGVRSFTGRVVKVGHRYLLEDALLGTTYDIEPQEAVREFEGMILRLDGALDPGCKIIRLQRPVRY